MRYVVLTDSRPDSSAWRERAFVRRAHAALRVVKRTRHVTIFAVSRPTSLITGPGRARVTRIAHGAITVAVARAGRYRLAVSYSPYWESSGGCLSRTSDDMLRLAVPRAGTERLTFSLTTDGVARALGGSQAQHCAGHRRG